MIDNVKHYTLPQLLLERTRQTPHLTALRLKEFGIWNPISYLEYANDVRYLATTLHSLGFKQGEKFAIIADNIPAWVYAELAAQSLGGISVGVYQSSVPSEIEYVLNYTDAVMVLAENQEQVDKLLEIRDKLPHVRKVIYEDPRGMRSYQSDDWFMSLEDAIAQGKKLYHSGDTVFDQMVKQGSPDDICHFSLTSGTTGNPKATMLSHKNLLHMGHALMQVDPLKSGDDYISFLPLAWIGEQMMTVAVALASGITVNFPEEVATAMEDLVEVGPHVIFSPPRVWEGIQSRIWVKIEEAYGLNRVVYKTLLDWGMQAADYSLVGKELPLSLKFKQWLAYWGLSRPIRDQLGFLRLKRAYTGGAALGPDIFRFFHALGINLKQIYGQTEIVGIAYLHRDGDVRFDTVGKPLPETEVHISETGEILSKSDAVCHGYYKKDKDTEELLHGGWLHSGDAGYLTPEGHLVVIDRLSDVMHTLKGERFSPQFIENKLKFSPFVKEAVVWGDKRDDITAFINIDPSTVGKWAEDRKIAYSTYMDLSSKPEVAELILGEVNKVNASLPELQRIRRFVLLYKLLDADDEELTRTGKVRRKFVLSRYETLVEALYGSAKNVRVMAEFKYQDGQTARVETEVKIHGAA